MQIGEHQREIVVEPLAVPIPAAEPLTVPEPLDVPQPMAAPELVPVGVPA